jgi:hypothetical protein
MVRDGVWEVRMGRLVLKIRRGSQVIGSWSLGDQPLEMTFEDTQTGEVLGRFIADGGAAPFDEVPFVSPSRVDGDDLTMPLPEHTASLELPLPESTSHSISLPAPVPGPELSHTRQFIADAIQQRRGAGLDLYTHSDDLSLPDADIRAKDQGALTDGGWTDEISVREDPSLEGGFVAPIAAAEVWLRKSREWHARGRLPAGSRLVAGGGWIGLDTKGCLVVNTGPWLTGTVTRLDGSSYELRSGTEPRKLGQGASVILREGESGVYVRSLVPEHGLDQPTEESPR